MGIPVTGDAIARLSPREREVFELYIEGHAQKEIAARLCLSVRTVATHKVAILRKLGCGSFVELIKFAIRNGLTTP